MVFKAEGIIPAVICPIDDDGKVYEDAFRKHLDYMIDNGVHALFVNGSQGEFYALTLEEKQQVLEMTVEHVKKRVPVYSGVGAVTTREAVALAKMSERVGAQALSAITPFFIKPNEDELYEHYKAIAEATSLPVLLYPNPARTNVPLPTNLVARLAQINNIIGIKDSSGDFTQTQEYIRLLGPKGFQVVAGRDTLILATLVMGGSGAIAATANVCPKVVVEIYESFKRGDMKAAIAAQYRLAPLRLAFTLGSFPVVIKEALRLMGIELGPSIKPVSRMKPDKLEELRKILIDLGLPVTC